jgi:hypothetical protein
MKKTARLLSALFTFSLSVAFCSVFFGWSDYKTEILIEPKLETIETSSIPLVSVCEIKHNPRLYKGREIRLKTNIYLLGELNVTAFEAKKACDSGFLDIEFWNTNEKTNSLAETNDEIVQVLKPLKKSGLHKSTNYTEVEIIGELYEREGLFCMGSLHYVKAKEIKQVSPVKQIALSEIFRLIQSK